MRNCIDSAADGDASSDDLITVRELGAILRISPASVYRLVERRSIPFYRFPRKLRFKMADVRAYREAGRVERMQ
jgi:excisionase family DNA binding protein